jgi:predicted Fe-Mo cluster-binding NifX family protein
MTPTRGNHPSLEQLRFMAHYMLLSSVMRIAIPQWQGRVSPVFDVAVNFLLIDVEGGQEIRREERRLTGRDLPARIAEFLSLGSGVLICGAISAPLEARLTAGGVQVISFTCGGIDVVLGAFLRGELAKRVFAMPGCCRRARQHEGGKVMARACGMGAGGGGGRHRQRRGQGPGPGRMGGPFTAGPGEFCVCPKCGEKAPHTAGQPCQQMVCPKCGGPMTRS